MKFELEEGKAYVVKPWGLMERQYGLTATGHIGVVPTVFNKEMREYCGSSITVTEIDGMSFKANDWWWSKDMFIGPAFEYGQKIRGWDDNGDTKHNRYFRGYAPRIDGRFSVITFDNEFLKGFSIWDNAEAIEEPSIKITCEVNGKAVPLSNISEETLLNIRKESK